MNIYKHTDLNKQNGFHYETKQTDEGRMGEY
jgi:hypothetical protein